ncbi:MAG TPA: hypothetical protein VFB74_27840, partial [Kribbellaceae bacterium]|nr:hypothetical protein [Kribbellaceae bacterium]
MAHLLTQDRGLAECLVYDSALSPVSEPMPTNSSDPTPAAIRPGGMTTVIVAPASPAASRTITA